MGTITLGNKKDAAAKEDLERIESVAEEIPAEETQEIAAEENILVAQENVSSAEEKSPRLRACMLKADPSILYEEKSLRGKHEKFYRRNDGIMKSVITAGAVHYENENGELCEIDNTLTDNGETFDTKEGKYKISFAKTTKQDGTVSMKSRDVSIEWNYLPEADAAEARAVAVESKEELNGKKLENTVVYENAAKGVNLEYEIQGENVKEKIVVREQQEAYKYRFELRISGVSPRLSEDGQSIEFYRQTADGEGGAEVKEAEIPAPFMYDGAGERSEEVYYELEQLEAGKYIFTVNADANWINSAERVLPVVIDPQIVTQNYFSFVTVTQSVTEKDSRNEWKTSTIYASQIAAVYFSQKKITTSKAKFNISKLKIPNYSITSAKLILTATNLTSGNNSVGSFVYNDGTKDVKAQVAAGAEFEIDVTNLMSEGAFQIEFKTEENLAYNTQTYFSTSAVRLEVEYLIDKKITPTEKSLDLVNGVSAKVNLYTGETYLMFTDAAAEDFLLGTGISHVYKMSGENFRCGENFRLNLHERFQFPIIPLAAGNDLYTDAFGTKYKVVKGEGNLSGYNYPETEMDLKYVSKVKALIDSVTESRNKPATYLTNGTYYKGFSLAGRLITVFDTCENSIFISYDADGRIETVTNNIEEKLAFAYAGGLLSSITDARGRKISYAYEDERLKTVTYPNGRKITFTYDLSGRITRVETTDGERATLTYSQGSQSFELYSTAGEIKYGKTAPSGTAVSLAKVTFTYSGNRTFVDYRYDHREIYGFDNSGNLSECYKEEGGVVVNAEQYKTTESGSLTVKTTNCAARSTLYQKSFENFTFQTDCVKVTKYSKEGRLLSTSASKVRVSPTSTVETSTTYEYANNYVYEKEIITYKDLAGTVLKTYTNETRKQYGADGKLSCVSYIPGDYSTVGRDYTSYEYDANGRQTRTIASNHLDSATEFVTEKKYNAKGQLDGEIDEIGNSLSYIYANHSNTVSGEWYRSGSKLTYGRGLNDDAVTSLKYSLPDGRNTTVSLARNLGEITRSSEGQTVLLYTYNTQRELSSVSLNGVADYVKYQTTRGTTSDTFVKTLISRDGVMNAEQFKTVTDKHGNVTQTYYNNAEQIKNTYDSGKLKETKDYISNETETYGYNYINPFTGEITNTPVDQLTWYTRGDYKETYIYDNHGYVTDIYVNGEKKYTYEYGDTSKHELKKIATPNCAVLYQKDVFGRLTHKNISVNGKFVSLERINYRSVDGDGTNLPAEYVCTNLLLVSRNYAYDYDARGNITEVKLNDETIVRYTYDAADRLTREDNKLLNISTKYVYDLNGNIAQKSQSVYTTDTTLTNATSVSYGYSGDKLVSYNGENFVYDKVGNPTTYRGKTAIWQKGRQLKFFNGVSFEYNGKGTRTKKGNIAFTYDSQGRLISQSNGLEFEYDATGVLGVKYNGNYYVYRKDVQGNVIALLDNLGRAVVQYVYDAWGNHAVLDLNGKDITSATNIGTLNPFRYRGYYYDTETGLYYLQTRYYDPELCRFMTIDGIEYVNYEPLSGHNLYAYCGNNPVMNVDPTGELFGLFLGLLALVGLGLTIGGVASGNNTLSAIGLAMVAVPALISGGMALVSGIATGATLTGIVGGVTVASGIGTGLFASTEWQQAITGNNWMLDAGMGEELYYGLMLTTASIATLGTFASTFCYNFNIKSIDGFGRFSKFGERGYRGIKFQTGAGKTRVLTFQTHSHVVGKSISQWHWQLQKWNPQTGRVAGTIKRWIWWNLRGF